MDTLRNPARRFAVACLLLVTLQLMVVGGTIRWSHAVFSEKSLANPILQSARVVSKAALTVVSATSAVAATILFPTKESGADASGSLWLQEIRVEEPAGPAVDPVESRSKSSA